MPKSKKPAGGRAAKNFEPRYGEKKTSFHDRTRTGAKPGSKSPNHRGYRAPEETAAGSSAPKTRWTATQRAGRDEARGIRSHAQGERPARSYDERPRGRTTSAPRGARTTSVLRVASTATTVRRGRTTTVPRVARTMSVLRVASTATTVRRVPMTTVPRVARTMSVLRVASTATTVRRVRMTTVPRVGPDERPLAVSTATTVRRGRTTTVPRVAPATSVPLAGSTATTVRRGRTTTVPRVARMRIVPRVARTATIARSGPPKSVRVATARPVAPPVRPPEPATPQVAATGRADRSARRPTSSTWTWSMSVCRPRRSRRTTSRA